MISALRQVPTAPASGSAAASAARVARRPAVAPRARAPATPSRWASRAASCPDAADPQAPRLHQPVPGGVLPGQRRRPRAPSRGTPPTSPPWWRPVSPTRGTWSRSSAAASCPGPCGSRPMPSPASAEAAITAAGGSVSIVPLPFGNDRPPASGNALTNR